MTSNPIIQRELIGMLRTRRALLLQVVLLIALSALVLLRWPTDAYVDQAESQAKQVLRVFGYGLMVGLILLAPVFPATSIVRERAQGTLALLLNSPMSSWSIIGGKLVGALGFVLLLLLLSLPPAAACFAMGGLDLFAQLGLMYLVLGLCAVQYATLGLLVSTFASKTDSSLRITYGLILVMSVLVVGPYQYLVGQAQGMAGLLMAADWLRSISPLPAMMHVLDDTAVGSAGMQESGAVALRFGLLAAISSLVFTAWAGARLHEKMLDRSRSAGTMTEDRSERAQMMRRIMFLWFFDPQRRDADSNPWLRAALALLIGGACAAGAVGWFSVMTPGDGIPYNVLYFGVGVLLGFAGAAALGSLVWMTVSRNPLMAKEQKCNRFGRGHWMMRLVGACVIVSLLLMLAAANATIGLGVEAGGSIMVIFQVALIVLVTPSLASGLISTERESKGWQLLQMTPLSAFSIVLGKLMAVTWTLGLLLIATLPGYVVLLAIKDDPAVRLQVAQVVGTLGLIALASMLISAAVSSLFERTAVATTVSYTILITLCAGTMLFWLGEDAPFHRSLVEKVLIFNPLAAALALLKAPGFTEYENLLPANWYVLGGICVTALLVLVVQVWRLTRPR